MDQGVGKTGTALYTGRQRNDFAGHASRGKLYEAGWKRAVRVGAVMELCISNCAISDSDGEDKMGKHLVHTAGGQDRR